MVRYRLTSLPASTSTYIQRFEVDPEVLDNASNDERKPYAARPRRSGKAAEICYITIYFADI